MTKLPVVVNSLKRIIMYQYSMLNRTPNVCSKFSLAQDAAATSWAGSQMPLATEAWWQ